MQQLRVYQTGLVLAISLAIKCTPVNAWNAFGHMVIASVAYEKLKPATRLRVKKLLKINPDYKKWCQLVESVKPELRDQCIFMLASTWPDVIKGEAEPYREEEMAYVADGTANGFRPSGPEAARNIGYSDRLMHKYWHFVGNPYSVDGTKPPKIPVPNIQTQIDHFRSILNSDVPDELKSYDLTWLIHLVGDVHQPLHCLSRVNKSQPLGDDGGFKLHLKCKGCESDLHAFWDASIGKGNFESAILKARSLRPAPKALLQEMRTDHWIDECVHLAKTRAYVVPINRTNGPFSLTKNYVDMAHEVAKIQGALAGERLAKILNYQLK